MLGLGTILFIVILIAILKPSTGIKLIIGGCLAYFIIITLTFALAALAAAALYWLYTS